MRGFSLVLATDRLRNWLSGDVATSIMPVKRTAALALAAVGATLLAVGAHASSSATNRPLVFVTNGDGVSELAVVRPDGSGFRKLTRRYGPTSSPSWTSDGERILFSSYDEFTDRNAKWRMRADGRERKLIPGGDWDPPSPSGESVLIGRRIVDLEGRTIRSLRFGALLIGCRGTSPPLWSPDGRNVALHMCTVAGRKDSSFVLVVPTAGRGVARAVTPRRNGHHESAVSWSPDSRRLLVRDDSGARAVWYTIARDGSDRRRLGPRWSGDHAWSPDSSTIAFVQSRAIMGVPIAGGHARRLVAIRSRGTQARYVSLDWSARDELAFSDVGGIYVARADGRGLHRVTVRRGAPNWSPDGQRIVFASGFSIFVTDRRGRGLRRLIEGWSWDDAPQWSLDGRRIAFVRGFNVYATNPLSEGETQVYVMSWNGRSERRVARGYEPRWSPDGHTLAFVRSSRPDSGPPRHRIVVADVDGGGGERREIAGLDPAWSPDGERLAFVRHAYDEARENDWVAHSSTLLIARPDGSDLRVLGDQEWLLRDPQWSPDGGTIAVSGFSENLQEDRLQLVDVETGAVRRLRGQPDSFAWSPDGRHIAFAECQSPRRERVVLAVIEVETGSTRTVDQSTGADSCPYYDSFAWSPDGSRIGYSRCTTSSMKACDVHTVNANGSQPRRITSTPGIERSLDW